MVELLTPEKFHSDIQSQVELFGLTYLETITKYCDDNMMEQIVAVRLIKNSSLEGILLSEANNMNMLRDRMAVLPYEEEEMC